MALPPSSHVATKNVRGKPAATVVKLSYATTDAARDAAWAVSVPRAQPAGSGLYGGAGGLADAAKFGVDARALEWPGDLAPVELHFVHALAPGADPGPAGLTVAALEAYAVGVHREFTPTARVQRDLRLRPADGHALWAALLVGDRSLDGALAAAAELSSPHTVWKKGEMYFLYARAERRPFSSPAAATRPRARAPSTRGRGGSRRGSRRGSVRVDGGLGSVACFGRRRARQQPSARTGRRHMCRSAGLFDRCNSNEPVPPAGLGRDGPVRPPVLARRTGP